MQRGTPKSPKGTPGVRGSDKLSPLSRSNPSRDLDKTGKRHDQGFGFGVIETIIETSRSVNKVVLELNTLVTRIYPLTQHTEEVEKLLKLVNQRLEALRIASDDVNEKFQLVMSQLSQTKPLKPLMESLESIVITSLRTLSSILTELFVSSVALVQRHIAVGSKIGTIMTDGTQESGELGEEQFETERQEVINLSLEVERELEYLDSVYTNLKESRISQGTERR